MKKGVHRCQEHPDRTFRGRPPRNPLSRRDRQSVSFSKPRSSSPSKTDHTESRRDERNQGGRRIIAAANQDLREMIKQEGSERISFIVWTFCACIPPRQPGGRNRELANHFLIALSQKYKLAKPSLSESSQLKSQAILGRQRLKLIHELERALVMNEKGQDLELAVSGLARPEGAKPQDASDWFNANFRFPDEGFDLENPPIDRSRHRASRWQCFASSPTPGRSTRLRQIPFAKEIRIGRYSPAHPRKLGNITQRLA